MKRKSPWGLVVTLVREQLLPSIRRLSDPESRTQLNCPKKILSLRGHFPVLFFFPTFLEECYAQARESY
jgi:hypothetical protein